MTADARAHSLRQRLLLFLLLAIAFAALLQGLGAYGAAVRQADEMFDQHLRQMAHTMRPGGPPPFAPPDDGPEMDFEIQIWGPDGVQLFRSPRSDLPQSAVLGFSDVSVQGISYRVYTVQTPMQTVQIAQNMSARDARARGLAFRAVLPVALMAPLLMAVVWW
ncbi:MAG: two-component sensor histidine kinase, partial [Lysobacteraceae bacterium]